MSHHSAKVLGLAYDYCDSVVFRTCYVDCWALSSGQPVVSIHVVVADEAKLDETRRQLSAHFAAAGVSREMGHLAIELEHQHKLSVSHSYHWPEQT